MLPCRLVGEFSLDAALAVPHVFFLALFSALAAHSSIMSGVCVQNRRPNKTPLASRALEHEWSGGMRQIKFLVKVSEFRRTGRYIGPGGATNTGGTVNFIQHIIG